MNQAFEKNRISKSICAEKVFNSFYMMNAGQLRNFIYYKCGQLDVAEDIVQLSFVRVWEKCREVVLEKAKSYLFTVASRLFLDHVKSKKVALKFMKEKTTEVNQDDPESVLISDEFREKIETAISDLPEGQREVFLLNRIDKLTYKEIAQQLNTSETAVEKKMGKALLKLRDKIEEFKLYKI